MGHNLKEGLGHLSPLRYNNIILPSTFKLTTSTATDLFKSSLLHFSKSQESLKPGELNMASGVASDIKFIASNLRLPKIEFDRSLVDHEENVI